MAAAEKNDDPIEAMISSRPPRRAPEAAIPPNPVETPAGQPLADETASPERPKPEAREPQVPPLRPPKTSALEARLEVRPIGTPMGLRELAALHKRTWKMLNVQEKRVHMLLWPLAIHFGLYNVAQASERRLGLSDTRRVGLDRCKPPGPAGLSPVSHCRAAARIGARNIGGHNDLAVLHSPAKGSASASVSPVGVRVNRLG